MWDKKCFWVNDHIPCVLSLCLCRLIENGQVFWRSHCHCSSHTAPAGKCQRHHATWIMTPAMDERKEAPGARHPVVAKGGAGLSDPNSWEADGDLSGGTEDVAGGSGKMKQKTHLSCKSSGLFFTTLCMSSPEADLFTATVRCFPCSLWVPPLTLVSFHLTACARFKWCAILC